MIDLALIRHLIHAERWSTARAMASGDRVALAYVRDHATRAPLAALQNADLSDDDGAETFSDGEGYGDDFGDGLGDGFLCDDTHGDGSSVDAYSSGVNGDGYGEGQGVAFTDAYGDGHSHGDGCGDGNGNGGSTWA